MKQEDFIFRLSQEQAEVTKCDAFGHGLSARCGSLQGSNYESRVGELPAHHGWFERTFLGSVPCFLGWRAVTDPMRRAGWEQIHLESPFPQSTMTFYGLVLVGIIQNGNPPPVPTIEE